MCYGHHVVTGMDDTEDAKDLRLSEPRMIEGVLTGRSDLQVHTLYNTSCSSIIYAVVIYCASYLITNLA
jgi:hypothetical protein